MMRRWKGGCPGCASHALVRGGLKELRSKAAWRRVVAGGDGELHWRAAVTFESGVWLELASLVPSCGCHALKHGRKMEMQKRRQEAERSMEMMARRVWWLD
jgi:hypothetical protein